MKRRVLGIDTPLDFGKVNEHLIFENEIDRRKLMNKLCTNHMLALNQTTTSKYKEMKKPSDIIEVHNDLIDLITPLKFIVENDGSVIE